MRAALGNVAITFIHRFGSWHIAATRRHFASCPQQALALLFQTRGGLQYFSDPAYMSQGFPILAATTEQLLRQPKKMESA
jgi:hypothetical protein